MKKVNSSLLFLDGKNLIGNGNSLAAQAKRSWPCGLMRARGVPAHLAVAMRQMWPSASRNGVGTPEHTYFAAQCLARTYPYQRFTPALTGDGA